MDYVLLRKKIKKILYSYLLVEDFSLGDSMSIDKIFLPKAINKIMIEIKKGGDI